MWLCREYRNINYTKLLDKKLLSKKELNNIRLDRRSRLKRMVIKGFEPFSPLINPVSTCPNIRSSLFELTWEKWSSSHLGVSAVSMARVSNDGSLSLKEGRGMSVEWDSNEPRYRAKNSKNSSYLQKIDRLTLCLLFSDAWLLSFPRATTIGF